MLIENICQGLLIFKYILIFKSNVSKITKNVNIIENLKFYVGNIGVDIFNSLVYTNISQRHCMF